MKPFTVKDFNGGMIDEYDDCAPRYAQRLRNFLLDPSGKPYSRNGTTLWAGPTSTGEKIGGMFVCRDISRMLQYQSDIIFLHSHYKVWVGSDSFNKSTSISQSAGPTNFTEIVGAGGSSVFPNASVYSKTKWQMVNQHIYVSNYDPSQISYPQGFARPRKIFPNSKTLNGKWFAANMGLPAYTQAGIAWVSNAGTGPSESYVYYFVYKVTYQIGATVYEVFGTPQIANIAHTTNIPQIGVSGGATNWSLVFPDNSQNLDIYPTVVSADATNITFAVAAYRTAANQSVPRWVADIPYIGSLSASWTDTTTDANLGAPLYTADGTAGYDEPPPCKIFHAVGDYGYYAGFDLNLGASTSPSQWAGSFPANFVGAIQSSPGVFESAPQSFTIATPDHLTAIESVDQYPIFFWRRGCARVEGYIDSYGNGTPVLRLISEKYGALRQSGVRRTDRGLIFCAEDGIYFTDGFAVKKLTDHLNKYYRQWWLTGDPASVDDIAMAYHAPSKRYFVGTRLATAPANSVAAPNTVIVGDLTHQTDEGGAATSYLDGQPNLSTLGYSFLPTAMEVYRDTLLVGDYNGCIQAIRLDPPTQGDYVSSDVGVDGSVASSSWISSPVVWDYISPTFDFGSRFLKKWVTRLMVTFKIRFPQSSVFAQIFSYNDEQFRDDSTNNGTQLNPVQETSIPLTRRLWSVMRRFRKGGGSLGLRCVTKQVRITKGFLILASSKPNGVQTAGTVTVDPVGKTALLSAGTWPANILGQQFFLDNDGYVQSYLIKAATPTTLTLLDPGGKLPSGAGHQWEIKGYPLDQGIALDSYTMAYDELAPGMEPMFNPSSTGQNS